MRCQSFGNTTDRYQNTFREWLIKILKFCNRIALIRRSSLKKWGKCGLRVWGFTIAP
jgi:hypothetical protein